MSSDTTNEALSLVNSLKTKIVIAAAIVMIKRAKAEGIPSAQYTKEFQQKYFSQNYERISTELKQQFLSHCHDDVFNKLRKAIPVSNKPVKISQNTKNCSLRDDDLDWIEQLCTSGEEEAARRQSLRVQPKSKSKLKNTFSCEESAMENIRFVQSMMTLIEESEKETPLSKNLLQSLLNDGSEHVRDFSKYKAGSVCSNHCSSDSGIGTCSDLFTENSCSVSLNSVSSGVVKSAIQSSKTKQPVLNSVRFVVDHLKHRIEEDVESVFQNWEGSELQFMNRILCKCSQVSATCREVLVNFIYNILEGIWLDRRLCQNRLWELKILIANEFITNIETCKEVNQYIIDYINYFIKCYGERPPDFPAIMDKLFLYVNLFSSVCDTLTDLKSNNTAENSQKDILSENYISLFWQERLCPKAEKMNDEDFEVSESEIQSLERLSIVTSARHPLLASLAHEVITKTRHLVNPRLYESQNDFDLSFSLT